MPFFNWSQMHRSVISPQYSTAEGPTIKGGQIEVGRYRFAPGTGSKRHQHPEEQVINVLSGKLRVRIGNEESILGPGEAALVPPNTEHQATAMDSEVEIISCTNIVSA